MINNDYNNNINHNNKYKDTFMLFCHLLGSGWKPNKISVEIQPIFSQCALQVKGIL